MAERQPSGGANQEPPRRSLYRCSLSTCETGSSFPYSSAILRRTGERIQLPLLAAALGRLGLSLGVEPQLETLYVVLQRMDNFGYQLWVGLRLNPHIQRIAAALIRTGSTNLPEAIATPSSAKHQWEAA